MSQGYHSENLNPYKPTSLDPAVIETEMKDARIVIGLMRSLESIVGFGYTKAIPSLIRNVEKADYSMAVTDSVLSVAITGFIAVLEKKVVRPEQEKYKQYKYNQSFTNIVNGNNEVID